MLLRLVNQILDFRKVESQKLKLSSSEIDLVLLVQNILSQFESAAALIINFPIYFKAVAGHNMITFPN